MIRRMRLDYNRLLALIDSIICKSKSKIVQTNADTIGIGLNLLSAYLREVAQRAIDTNDEWLIEWCCDLHILKKNEGEMT